MFIGGRGKKMTWNPVNVALYILDKEVEGITKQNLSRLFKTKSKLAHWKDEWERVEEDLLK
jgi:hypothetical protein